MQRKVPKGTGRCSPPGTVGGQWALKWGIIFPTGFYGQSDGMLPISDIACGSRRWELHRSRRTAWRGRCKSLLDPERFILTGIPVSSRQQGELSIVSGIHVAPFVWLIDRIEHYPHEDTADGMNGLMAVEPFVQQPFERVGHRRYLAQCSLVFDNHMGDGTKLRSFKLRPDVTMVMGI